MLETGVGGWPGQNGGVVAVPLTTGPGVDDDDNWGYYWRSSGNIGPNT